MKHKSQNLIFSDEFVGGPNQCEKDDPFCYVSKLKFYSQHIPYFIIYFPQKLFFFEFGKVVVAICNYLIK